MTDRESPAAPEEPLPGPPAPHAPEDAPADVLPDAPAQAPGAAPAAVDAPRAEEDPAARRTRRRKAALRWSAAALVCALAGTGSALAVTAPERTDIPGLATRSDGRYVFPALTLPPLPSGSAVPRENKSRHAADLRRLLLPAPREAVGTLAPAATASPTASPTGGTSPSASGTAPALAERLDCTTLLADEKDPAKLHALLVQYACRAATAREWTASDGTRTRIRLMAFGSSKEAWPPFVELRDHGNPKDIDGLRSVTPPDWDMLYGVNFTVRETPPGAPGTQPAARLAYLSAGDIVAVITMTNPGGVSAAAFQQVVTFQSALLT
ncbi:hypothetical protein [Kitasatospora purpeofusca]|uniref:hypothetical protein n=1 Tax=Kitasatospora purpeofusca TaxID=67352 RepID=UPI002A5A420C|nr:hypothetical protein [Kitasatospora purpeofusca]MDY0811203.1 hypothetical protein [Kitasatospora purpeofusca]